jgi:hypothetical protein
MRASAARDEFHKLSIASRSASLPSLGYRIYEIDRNITDIADLEKHAVATLEIMIVAFEIYWLRVGPVIGTVEVLISSCQRKLVLSLSFRGF